MTERGIVSVPVGIMMISSNLVVEMIGVVEGDDGCYADPRPPLRPPQVTL